MKKFLFPALALLVAGCSKVAEKKDAQFYYERGMGLFHEDDYAAAVLNFDKAIELNPKYAEAYFYRGVTLFIKDGSMDAAWEDYHKANEVKDENAERLETIPVDKEKIVVEDVVDFKRTINLFEWDNWYRDKILAGESPQSIHHGFLEREGNKNILPIANSLIAQKQESYLGAYYRVRYLAFPDFRNEIPDPGADIVKGYYAGRYREAKKQAMPTSLYDCDTVVFPPSYMDQYHETIQTYSVEYAPPYLSVIFYVSEYYGGATGRFSGDYSDVFDLRTGKKLEMGDVAPNSDVINTWVREWLLVHDLKAWHEPFDIRETPASSFYMTKDGLVLIFKKYALLPGVYGIPRILIPPDGQMPRRIAPVQK